jgi:hypothetical protein
MDKSGGHHRIRSGCSSEQAFQVLKVASMHLGTSGGKRLGSRIRANKT